jgi:SAM-dependent methyltransferase
MSDRLVHRQGSVILRAGIPYANPESTLSLLPGAAIGEWLAANSTLIRGSLLDLGCGTQPYRIWYEPLADKVTALDAAPLPGVDVVAMADDIPLLDGSFDTVLATEVLEHVDNAEAAMSEIHRVLKPGGHALFTVPYFYPTHEAPHDNRRFTHHGLIGLARRHNLTVLSTAAKGGLTALLAHYAVMLIVEASDRLWMQAGGTRAPVENAMFRKLLAAPQEAAIRRRQIHRDISGTATRINLGYMMACIKSVE